MNLIDNSTIRRRDRILDEQSILELIQSADYGTLSMVETNETNETKITKGYGIPLNYVYNEQNNCLYFHGAYEGKKVELLKQNPNVSFCIVGKTNVIGEKLTTEYQSVIIEGRIELCVDGEEKTNALYELVGKHVKLPRNQLEEQFDKMIMGSYQRTQVMKLIISKISGKSKKVL